MYESKWLESEADQSNATWQGVCGILQHSNQWTLQSCCTGLELTEPEEPRGSWDTSLRGEVLPSFASLGSAPHGCSWIWEQGGSGGGRELWLWLPCGCQLCPAAGHIFQGGGFHSGAVSWWIFACCGAWGLPRYQPWQWTRLFPPHCAGSGVTFPRHQLRKHLCPAQFCRNGCPLTCCLENTVTWFAHVGKNFSCLSLSVWPFGINSWQSSTS